MLQRLVTDQSDVCWVLVGDDGADDPELFGGLVRRFPDQVRAIALRRVAGAPPAGLEPAGQVGDVPVLRATNGQELALILLRLPRPDGVSRHIIWFWHRFRERASDAFDGPPRGSGAIAAWMDPRGFEANGSNAFHQAAR